MRLKHTFIYAGLIGLWVGVSALADWTVPTPGGSITFDAFVTGGGTKQLPKNVMSDSAGAQVGTSGNPIAISHTAGGNTVAVGSTGAVAVNATQMNGAAISNSNAVPISQVQSGAVVSASNPLSSQISQSGAVLSNSNPTSIQVTQGGTVVSGTNPLQTTAQAQPITYSCGVYWTTQSNAAVVFEFQGSASKTIKIKRISLMPSSTNVWYTVERRSSASSGGGGSNSSNSFIAKNDVNDANSTATLTHFTLNPTPGTFVGTVRAVNQLQNAIEWKFHSLNEKPLTLRGISEFFTINLLAANASTTIFVYVEWSEE
jgi:hypothetical protein